MGMDIKGQICFGVKFEEDYEFPWDKKEYDYDINDWWLYEVLKYKPSFTLYDNNGDYLGGKTPPSNIVIKYYEERRIFIENSQTLPIELINYYIDSYSMFIIAVPGTYIHSLSYDLVCFDPMNLKVTQEQTQNLVDFCNKYELKYIGEPGWYISGYYG